MVKNIAFVGATGMLGKPVAKELIKAGFNVKALVRDEQKASVVLPEGIQFLTGDLKNQTDLENLFTNQDAVYLNLNLDVNSKKDDFQAEREGLKNIIEAARKCNLKRIAIISSLVMNYQGMNAFHWWVFDLKKEAVSRVKQSGLPYTIFYPSTFMENFLTTYRQGNRIILAGKSKHKMYFISGEDFGRQVVRSFQILNRENKEYFIQGTEGFTANEAAEEFRKYYTAAKLTISKAPLGLMQFLGKFNQKINYGHHIVEALNNYPEKFESSVSWEELGEPIITLKKFAQSI